ncbi:MAG: VWA domain-containing protein [Flavisolibacter sp.]
MAGFHLRPKTQFYKAIIKYDSLPSFENAIGFKGKNSTSSIPPLTLVTGTINDAFQIDSTNTTGYFFAEIRVGTHPSFKNTPLNLSIVVDRSGSMAGEKIEFAKKSAKRIIDRLDSSDYVSIIEYDNFIHVLQGATPDTNKKEIKSRIDKMASRGSTNLWGGTEKGYQEVMRNYKSGFINRVLLISDGQANVGITNPATIKFKVRQYRDSGISLSTFGVGLDYNELLMTQMAETGSGHYYFIDSANKMTLLFEKELASMFSLEVRKTKLKIWPPPGVQLVSLSGEVMEHHGNEVSLKLDDLFSGEIKSFLFRYTIPEKIKKPMEFKTSVEYVNLTENEQRLLSTKNMLTPTKEKKSFLSYYNNYVIDQVILFFLADNLDRSLLLSDEGNFTAAKELLLSNNRYLSVNAFFVKQSEELKKIEVLNQKYLAGLSALKKMNKNDVKMMQKIIRREIYALRNKK